jgi:beta-glucosidase
MPKDMATVERQKEDVPHDMIPYKDRQGNTYDFGFGLNRKGPIKDKRTNKYAVKKK